MLFNWFRKGVFIRFIPSKSFLLQHRIIKLYLVTDNLSSVALVYHTGVLQLTNVCIIMYN